MAAAESEEAGAGSQSSAQQTAGWTLGLENKDQESRRSAPSAMARGAFFFQFVLRTWWLTLFVLMAGTRGLYAVTKTEFVY